MPNSGDSQNGYIWYDAPEDEKGQALPKGWYSDADGSFGGAGAAPTGAKDATSQDSDENITAQSLYEQETGQTWPPQEPEFPGSKKMVPDKAEMRYWQTQAFAQRKAARDEKAKEAKALEERTYKESQAEEERKYKESQAEAEAEAKAAETKRKEGLNQPSVNDALAAAFQRGQESGDFTEYQSLLAASKPPPAPARTPTLDELLVEAVLESYKDGGAAALALWDFAHMPSQAERLKLAIAASQSPADYLATVGMMRGEIPIPQQPAGSYRLGPESQAFAAYGVGGQGGGGQGAAGGRPLGSPDLQSFLEARGGGGVQTNAPGGQTALPGSAGQGQGMTWTNPGSTPALALIDRQIQAMVAAGDTAQTPEEQAQIEQRIQMLQSQRQQVWQQQQQGGGTPYMLGGGQGQQEITQGKQLRGDVPGDVGYAHTVGGLVKGKITTDEFGRPFLIPDKEQTGLGGTGEGVNPDIARTKNLLANATDPNEVARLKASLGQMTGNYQGISPSTTSNQAAAGKLPSFLEGAYGKEALSGAALKQRMSYPELAQRQGVTVPRFRSAQARSMQTPLEQRMFEAGLQQQGIDVPTWKWQEEAGTTPGGSRRRRVQTGY